VSQYNNKKVKRIKMIPTNNGKIGSGSGGKTIGAGSGD
jgi:hypothetical protein